MNRERRDQLVTRFLEAWNSQDVERVLGLSVMGAIPALETAQASARRRARTSGPPPR